jgi:DNA-directed RNA polymerase subunit RPC12/RpoP
MRPFPHPERVSKPRKKMGRLAPYTVADFNAEFRNDDICLEYVREQRWPTAVTDCVKCGNRWKHHRVTGRTAYACGRCGNQIYPLAGTIFAKSRMPLKKWFYAIYLMGSTACTISAKQLQREIGVTYKTAWRLSRSIRELMASESPHHEGSLSQLDGNSKCDDRGVALGDNSMPLVVKTSRCDHKTVRDMYSGGPVSWRQ